MKRQSLRAQIIAAIEENVSATIDETVDGIPAAAADIMSLIRRHRAKKSPRTRMLCPRVGSKCTNWPNCSCIAQGYRDRVGMCGPKPKPVKRRAGSKQQRGKP